jgi:hypothetical protein
MHNSGAPRRGKAKACVMNTEAPHLRLSSPAKAGDPVFRDADAGFDKLRRTGYSAFAEYDGFMRSNDKLLFIVARHRVARMRAR